MDGPEYQPLRINHETPVLLEAGERTVDISMMEDFRSLVTPMMMGYRTDQNMSLIKRVSFIDDNVEEPEMIQNEVL